MRSIMVFLVTLLAGSAAPASDVGDVFKTVKNSVVVIETTQREVASAGGPSGLVSAEGLGSGVLISDDGKVMTAAHVVQIADKIVVRMADGQRIPARVLSSEPGADLALVQLDLLPRNATVATLGDSDAVEVGDQVLVVGAPLGMDYTLTVGHISARRNSSDEISGTMAVDQFQTDAAINIGNSGGPMFDMQGRVIGIVSYIISQSGGFEGLGFVITSNMARKLLFEQRSFWSGLQGRMLSGEAAALLNVPQSAGLLIEQVAEGSLATHLGLRGGATKVQIEDVEVVLGGDIVLECFGVSFAGENAGDKIRERVNALKDGDKMVLKVLRRGEVIELKNYFFPDLLIPPVPSPD